MLNIISKIIQDEIKNDPENLGYVGKTNKEIMDLLNNPYEKIREIKELQTARINILLPNIQGISNTISENDLNEILTTKVEEV
ncbi:MAG: hypothetical protein V1768_02030 [Patescibacteria group bacterium]